MINANDAQNLLVLLQRVNLTAKEVDVYVALRSKLEQLTVGPVDQNPVPVAPPAVDPSAEMPREGEG